ncbi:MAG: aminomethyl-transferring glycine dehydrogenase subunit GcvPB, partial [Spirochaetota bacterium]
MSGDQARRNAKTDGPGIRGLLIDEPLIFERGSEGRRAVALPRPTRDEQELAGDIPARLLRGPVEHFPQVGQGELVRHYTRLSQYNYGVDTGFYPLGSCTMKY